MQPEKIFELKRSVDAFRNAFKNALLKENDNVQKISDMMYDIINHLAIASENIAMMNMSSGKVDLEEFKYKCDCAIDDALECVESILATMRTNPICDKLKMALTGACLIVKADLNKMQ